MLPVVQFRDPPPAEARAEELRQKIARVLFAAPKLPVDLPLFDLTLKTIEVKPDRLDLQFERQSAPIATVFLDWPEGQPQLRTQLRWDGGDRSALTRAVSQGLMTRMQTAITRARWDEAQIFAEELQNLPLGSAMVAFRQLVPGVHGGEGLVRTGFGCNQDCGLCWQGRKWGRVNAEQVITWIDDLKAGGATKLIISGGEPTLDPDLARYIEHGRALKFEQITLETNAIQLAKPGHVEKLKAAGLTDAFVSLHSGDPKASDLITRAPGTHGRTVKGIIALLEGGVRVQLNAVITTLNIESLAALPDFVYEMFDNHPNLRALVVSDFGDAYETELIPKLIPHPDRVREVLPKFIERALALRVPVEGLGQACGPHLCMFGADSRIAKLTTVHGPLDFRTYLPGCNGCSLKWACLGVRKAHATNYGDASIQPVA